MRPKRRIDYSEVMSQVSKIKTLASKTSTNKNKVAYITNETTCAWKGDSSKAFLDGCVTIEGNLDTSSKSLRILADKISKVARDIKEEDDRRIERYEREQREKERQREKRRRERRRHERSRST